MRIFLLLALVLASSARAQAGANGITAEARAEVTLFQTYCLPASADFADVNKRATQAGLKLIADQLLLGAHLKQWVARDAAGLLSLHIWGTDASSPSGKFGCGVNVRTSPASAVETLLSADPRLGTPSKRINTRSKSGVVYGVVWYLNLGPRGGAPHVILVYGAGLSGPTVDLLIGYPPD